MMMSMPVRLRSGASKPGCPANAELKDSSIGRGTLIGNEVVVTECITSCTQIDDSISNPPSSYGEGKEEPSKDACINLRASLSK